MVVRGNNMTNCARCSERLPNGGTIILPIYINIYKKYFFFFGYLHQVKKDIIPVHGYHREILDLVPCIDFNVYFVDRYMCIFIMIVDRYVYFY